MATGFSFGAKTTAAPTFGTGSITFGTPASQPQQFGGFGNLSSSAPSLFGTQAAPTTSALGFKPAGFGAPASTPSGGFAFGAAAPSFGAAVTTAAAPGFGFGAPAAAFGTPASTAAPTGLGLKPPATSGLSFGAPASTFGAPATTGVAFGAPASTGISFGAPAPASTGLGFGSVASAAPAFGAAITTPSMGINFGATTSAPATGLSFGAAATSAPTLGVSFGAPSTSAPTLSFGAPASTSSGFSFGGGLGGLGGLITTSAGLGLTTATTTQQSVGLGGVAFAQSKTGAASTAQKEAPPKEQPLPNEFLPLVEHFKSVLQEEKNRSSEISRCSVMEFSKIEAELDALNYQLSLLENQLFYNRSAADRLKHDSAKGLQNIEMAQRTQETPPNLQLENTAPLQFFLDLANSFERDMQQLKLRIDKTEKLVKKSNESSVLTSEDLVVGLKRLHETFVVLAGRMQSVHNQVESQKGIYVGLRKRALKDNTNPFESTDKYLAAVNVALNSALKATPPTLASGPTPFNSIALGSNNIAAQNTQYPPRPEAATNTPSTGFSLGNAASSFGSQAQNTSMFNKPTGFGAATPFQMNTSANFQLQKPPTGNKRGKQ